jgi:hypothetical protein
MLDSVVEVRKNPLPVLLRKTGKGSSFLLSSTSTPHNVSASITWARKIGMDVVEKSECRRLWPTGSRSGCAQWY